MLTPKLCVGSNWTRRLYCPGPSPARSTNASMVAARIGFERVALPADGDARHRERLDAGGQAVAQVALADRHARITRSSRRRARSCTFTLALCAADQADEPNQPPRSSRRRSTARAVPGDRQSRFGRRCGDRVMWLSGPTTSTSMPGSEVDLTDDKSWRRLPLDRRADLPASACADSSSSSEIVAGVDLQHVDAVRHTDILGAHIEQPRPGRAPSKDPARRPLHRHPSG